MKVDRFVRLMIAFVIALLFLVALAALLFVTESVLNVWERLDQGPTPLLYLWVSVVATLAFLTIWLIWRLAVRRKPASPARAGPAKLTREEIEARLRAADAAGIETDQARAELHELASRQQAGAVHLCFFGEISSGKSSLIRALVPGADVIVDAVGGSTRNIRHYRWQDATGSKVLLTDVPGTGGTEEGLDDAAAEEARRAHVVLFVCEGDLTRADRRTIEWLLKRDKPLVLVMNKSDRYDAREQAQLMERLLDHLSDMGGEVARDRVVAVSAGGQADVIERSADGSERVARRERPADVGVLIVAINRLLQQEVAELDARRDRAVFSLAAQKLDEAEARYREQRSGQIIRSSTRKAVVGALAAVSPGTDIVIQGYIGTTMTNALCKLYGAAPRDLDIEEFLSLSQSRVGRALPLSLAVAGNGLKAFPGVGTVAGGLVHAVAYGLIFDALGKSLVQSLKKHGELDAKAAAKEFEEDLSGNLESGVRQVAKMALAVDRQRRRENGGAGA
ncbi:MAG TPA: GTPase [Woeseiaceae bacterium]|nr:GTPase [Woeseiaceae bacterium]